jgi:hypothetical protein
MEQLLPQILLSKNLIYSYSLKEIWESWSPIRKTALRKIGFVKRRCSLYWRILIFMTSSWWDCWWRAQISVHFIPSLCIR